MKCSLHAANLLVAKKKKKTKRKQKAHMRKSILDQFAADAINAPETVTGGRRGHGGTRTRTRTRGNGANAMMAANHRGRGRTRTRTRHS